MNALQLARAVFAKKTGAVDAAADAGLPWGARIGSLVTLKINPFLRAHGSLVGLPESVQTVVGVSRLHVGLDGSAYRLYTALGDADSEPESFIQLYASSAGEVLEVVYFRRLVRIIPETSDEQDAFLGESAAGLGQLSFAIERCQMDGLSLGEGLIEDAFGPSQSITYERAIGKASSDFVAPLRGTENRIDDAAGTRGLRQAIVFMPYQRTLAGGATEQLLISTEIVSDRHGNENAREIHVDFMVGLVLGLNDVLVQ